MNKYYMNITCGALSKITFHEEILEKTWTLHWQHGKLQLRSRNSVEFMCSRLPLQC